MKRMATKLVYSTYHWVRVLVLKAAVFDSFLELEQKALGKQQLEKVSN